jgi:deoxyribonuclease-4
MGQSNQQPECNAAQDDGQLLQAQTLTIGCHLSSAKGYTAMARTAVGIGANTFQFFTRNPRGGKAKALDPKDLEQFHTYAADHGITRILAHAPYTLNAAGASDKVRNFAQATFEDDLCRMDQATPHQMYNFHPGCHVKQGAEVGIDRIVEIVNRVVHEDQTTMVLLETMAGKGTEVGRSFEEIAQIIDRIQLSDHIGVCLDTCHVWDAGYDIVNDLDGVLDAFDRTIGLDRLHAIHLNDSLNPRGSHKDRHACIGEGTIGFDALSAVTRHPRLRSLPFYLETPNDLDGYAQEIARLRAAWDKAL